MLQKLDFHVFTPNGNHVASFKFAEDAAACVANHSHGASVRLNSGHFLWIEGDSASADGRAAWSYDKAAALMMSRVPRCTSCNEMMTDWQSGAPTGARGDDATCRDCTFWIRQQRADAENPCRSIVISGNHFTLGQQNGPLADRGYGGRLFKIRFHDGRTITTTDLWDQGPIPPRFRDSMPDNAVFLNEPPQAVADAQIQALAKNERLKRDITMHTH